MPNVLHWNTRSFRKWCSTPPAGHENVSASAQTDGRRLSSIWFSTVDSTSAGVRYAHNMYASDLCNVSLLAILIILTLENDEIWMSEDVCHHMWENRAILWKGRGFVSKDSESWDLKFAEWCVSCRALEAFQKCFSHCDRRRYRRERSFGN